MKWPWARAADPRDRLAFSLGPAGLAWALADIGGPRPRLHACGVQPWPATATTADDATAAAALRGLGLHPGQGIALLPLPGYQMLQIEAPAVPADELRAAARWRIREMVDAHVDDLTLDVLRVGRLQAPAAGHGQLFVVAAPNAGLERIGRIAQAAGWPLQVIDVTDLAQRNLHTAAAAGLDLADRATACLMRHGAACLLTICVGDELHYSRRLDWDAAVAAIATPPAPAPFTAGDDGSPGFADLPMAVELGVALDDTPRMVVELQRSFDVWERSWPDLPLALLLLHDGAAGDSPAAAFLQDRLGLRVMPLDLAAALDAAALADAAPAVREACTPLLGALLRDERPPA